MGTPNSWNFFMTRKPSIGVWSDGFTITLLPHTNAADICPIKIATGKFHGLIQRNLPLGPNIILFSSPVGPSNSSLLKILRASWE